MPRSSCTTIRSTTITRTSTKKRGRPRSEYKILPLPQLTPEVVDGFSHRLAYQHIVHYNELFAGSVVPASTPGDKKKRLVQLKDLIARIKRKGGSATATASDSAK